MLQPRPPERPSSAPQRLHALIPVVSPMRFYTSPDMQTRSPSSETMALMAIALVAALSVLLNPTPALAQDSRPGKNLTDMSLEELMSVRIDSVYGASGFKQKVTEAPASVTIITAEDIQRYGYRTLADLLRNVPGFYVNYDRNYSYVGVRGFGLPGHYNNTISLLVDGHRLNDNIFDGNVIGTDFPVDV